MRKILSLALALCLLCSAALGEEWLLKNNAQPQPGSLGGEWTIIALARGGAQVEDGCYQNYLDALEQALIACDGQLSSVRYTEYSRTALALAALGEDPTDFRGFNLLEPLRNVDNVKIQGNNGLIWALIALDSNDYEGFEDARAALLEEVLAMPNEDGGFGIALGSGSNPDMTAMAMTALAAHRDDLRAAECLSDAVAFLSGFEAAGEMENNCETTAWAMIAYSSLNLRQDAERLRGMLEQYALDGGYRHVLEQDKADPMATEQAAYAIAAYQRMENGENRLFDMRDAK